MKASEANALFESAFLLVEEAEEALCTYTNAEIEFLRSDPRPANLVYERDVQSQGKICKLVFSPTPKLLRRKASSIVTHTRHALDQAVYAATCAIDGIPSSTRTYFPFAADPNDFDTLFTGRQRCSSVSKKLIPFLKQQRPWFSVQGNDTDVPGNDILRTLGKISGPNKHQISLECQTSVQESIYRKPRATKGFVQFLIPPQRTGFNELTIYRTDKDSDFTLNSLEFAVYMGITEAYPDVPARTLFIDFIAIAKVILYGLFGLASNGSN